MQNKINKIIKRKYPKATNIRRVAFDVRNLNRTWRAIDVIIFGEPQIIEIKNADYYVAFKAGGYNFTGIIYRGEFYPAQFHFKEIGIRRFIPSVKPLLVALIMVVAFGMAVGWQPGVGLLLGLLYVILLTIREIRDYFGWPILTLGIITCLTIIAFPVIDISNKAIETQQHYTELCFVGTITIDNVQECVANANYSQDEVASLCKKLNGNLTYVKYPNPKFSCTDGDKILFKKL